MHDTGFSFWIITMRGNIGGAGEPMEGMKNRSWMEVIELRTRVRKP